MKRLKLALVMLLFLSPVIPHAYSGATRKSEPHTKIITYMYGDQVYLQFEYTGKKSVTEIESRSHYQRITKVTGTADILFKYSQGPTPKLTKIDGGKFQMIEKIVDDKPLSNKMKKDYVVDEALMIQHDEYELTIKVPGKFLYTASRDKDSNYRIDHSVKYPGEPEITLPSV